MTVLVTTNRDSAIALPRPEDAAHGLIRGLVGRVLRRLRVLRIGQQQIIAVLAAGKAG